MPMTEEGTNPPNQAPQLDYDALGKAVANNIKPLIPQQQPAQPPATVSQFQEAIKTIRSQEGTDQDSLNNLIALFEAQRSDMTVHQQQAVGQVLIGERIRQAKQTLDSEISRAVEADEDLARFADAVRVMVTKEFDESPELQEERDKLVRGDFDAKAVRKLVNKHFNNFAGKKAAANSGVSGMTNNTGLSQATAQKIADGSNFKDLNERQKELYYGIKAEYARVGNRDLSGKALSEAEVEQDALRRASSKFR